jgi:hypothetical protein
MSYFFDQEKASQFSGRKPTVPRESPIAIQDKKAVCVFVFQEKPVSRAPVPGSLPLRNREGRGAVPGGISQADGFDENQLARKRGGYSRPGCPNAAEDIQ